MCCQGAPRAELLVEHAAKMAFDRRYLTPEQYKQHTGMKHPALKTPKAVKMPAVGTAHSTEKKTMTPVSDYTHPVSMLTADLPFGLPALEEISQACVRIGAMDKTWTQYLCSTSTDGWEYDAYDACEISPDFSDYYGVQVAVCLRKNL